jgi:predicted AAA+ superfamily ATPase
LFDAIKMAVDSSRRRKKFILSGSANLLLMKTVTESLAGRALYIELGPMTYGELHGAAEADNFTELWNPDHREPEQVVGIVDPLPLLLRGFLPPLVEMVQHKEVLNWLEGYWRTATGKEVDFVLEHGKRLLAFEVKLTSRPTVYDIQNLLLFLEEYPETVRGVLVHGGERVQWLHSKVIAVPWWWLDV